MQRQSVKEISFYLGFGSLTLLLASLPYILATINTPQGHVFTGLTYNQDDGAVYLSWLRQAADGHFFQRNLFNTEPQRGALVNLWSLLLGNFARLTGLSLPAVYHIARVLFGAGFLWAVTRLLRETVASAKARQIGFALVCLSGGLGWLTGGFDPTRGDNQPIDLWQPEALSFLSLYFTPLFLSALALIAIFAGSVVRAERTGKPSDIVPAAIAGALLGNFHSYDVIPLFLTWIVYRIVQDGLARKLNIAGWLRLVVAGIVTLPFLGYQYYALIQDPLFRARNVATPSPMILWTLLGFGLPLVLAIVEVARRSPAVKVTNGPPATTPSLAEYDTASARQWLLVWAIVGIGAAYLPNPPFDFQRKLIMGVHLPLCVLAGVALSRLTAKLSGDFPKIAVAAAVLFTVPSSALFLLRDRDRVSQNIGSTENRPYLSAFEAEALNYLRQNARASDAVLCSPDATSQKRFPGFPLRLKLATYVPAWTGLPVYVGHGSETANWGRKWQETLQFFRQDADTDARRNLLTDNGITWVLYDNRLGEGTPTFIDGSPVQQNHVPYVPVNWQGQEVPGYLQVAYRNPEITILRVVPAP